MGAPTSNPMHLDAWWVISPGLSTDIMCEIWILCWLGYSQISSQGQTSKEFNSSMYSSRLGLWWGIGILFSVVSICPTLLSYEEKVGFLVTEKEIINYYNKNELGT